MSETSHSCQIITFYSYKGGTGRTMALANVAWILAANGKRVLTIDWDLEAPGLHRYFLPFLDDPDLRDTGGIVEIVTDHLQSYADEGSEPPLGLTPSDFADPGRYAVALQYEFERGGALHLLAAGRQDSKYAERVRAIDWGRLYESFGGRELIQRLSDRMRAQYDYVLIDSRTGVADSAGICTMLLPDQLVLCFTYNRQSIEGVAAVARSVRSYRELRDQPVKIFPLPTRVVQDVEGLNEARDFAQAALTPSVAHLSERDVLEAYWRSAEVPHYPAYGFEEQLATFREVAGGRNNMLADMEWLSGKLCAGAPLALPAMPKETRERYLRRFRLRDPRRAALAELLRKEPTVALPELRSMAASAIHEEPSFQLHVAEAFDTIARTLEDGGRLEDALGATQEAVTLRRQAVAANPDGIDADGLAASLNNLGYRLSALGRREDARAAAQEALVHYRRLAKSRPDTFEPYLAASLNNLGTMLSALGRHEDALATAQEALVLYRRLAKARPDAFEPDLAMSLNNLGAMLSDLGRRKDALAAAQEALTIQRRLAKSRPDAFEPDLAMSLNNLGNMLSDLGRREDALAAAQEALNIRRRLAKVRPDAFEPHLAMSLNNLGKMLRELGRREDALAAAQEALDLYRRLAEARPDAFEPDLAISSNNLGNILSDLGRREDALDAAREAAEVLLPHALRVPGGFDAWLKVIAANYVRRCEDAGVDPDETLLTRIGAALRNTPG